MDLQKIEKLLQKYYNGETSLEEEEVLRTFFSSRDVPDHLEAEKELFSYYYSQSRDEAANPGLEEKILDAIRIEG
ncbi:MAG: pyruvate ferredoxin oxidoreductase, partial [Bacteroidales bacterium]|nr:pyruvate ferredoxin oxidoreductase [Bacteroidales bacterium]